MTASRDDGFTLWLIRGLGLEEPLLAVVRWLSRQIDRSPRLSRLLGG
jgi:hypothetical protein